MVEGNNGPCNKDQEHFRIGILKVILEEQENYSLITIWLAVPIIYRKSTYMVLNKGSSLFFGDLRLSNIGIRSRK